MVVGARLSTSMVLLRVRMIFTESKRSRVQSGKSCSSWQILVCRRKKLVAGTHLDQIGADDRAAPTAAFLHNFKVLQNVRRILLLCSMMRLSSTRARQPYVIRCKLYQTALWRGMRSWFRRTIFDSLEYVNGLQRPGTTPAASGSVQSPVRSTALPCECIILLCPHIGLLSTSSSGCRTAFWLLTDRIGRTCTSHASTTPHAPFRANLLKCQFAAWRGSVCVRSRASYAPSSPIPCKACFAMF